MPKKPKKLKKTVYQKWAKKYPVAANQMDRIIAGDTSNEDARHYGESRKSQG